MADLSEWRPLDQHDNEPGPFITKRERDFPTGVEVVEQEPAVALLGRSDE